MPVGHVSRLGDLVGDPVPADRQEVAEHDLGDRAQARSSPRPATAPTMACSEIGVSRTRSGPNRSSKPAVALNMPPAAATSSPIRNTDGSRSISWAIPPRRPRGSSVAPRRTSVAQSCGSRPPGRAAASPPPPPPPRRLPGGLLLDRRERLLGGAECGQPRPVGRDRVAPVPGLDLARRPVLRRIGPRVAAMAIGERLDQRGPAAAARGLTKRPGLCADELGVVAVDEDRRRP